MKKKVKNWKSGTPTFYKLENHLTELQKYQIIRKKLIRRFSNGKTILDI